MRFTLKDFSFSLITGLITGFIGWRVFEFLKIPHLFDIPWIALIVVVPVLWMFGVMLGYFLARWMPFFAQFGKFAAIGFTNAAVDFGVLNLLISLTGTSSGATYTLFKATSFLCAIIPSYVWNKYWAFNSANSRGGGFEFTKFISVGLISIFVNDGVASAVVNYVHPILNLNPHQWANFGAVIGSATALIFSFVGFKFAVFKK
ncbi:MAG TPA: GtrA family protein [Candidatus Paceibacterota bacterium]|nr:GtrA family protein [Candidatus Paceibacterota bacterium]